MSWIATLSIIFCHLLMTTCKPKLLQTNQNIFFWIRSLNQMTEFSWHERIIPCLSPNPPLLYSIYSYTQFFVPLGLKILLFHWVSCITVIFPLDSLVSSAQLSVCGASGSLNEVTVFRSVIQSLGVLLGSPRPCILPLRSFVPSCSIHCVKVVFPTSVSITN